MEYDREMIELEEELAIGFIRYGDKYIEFLAPFFSLDFPELTEEDFADFRAWADEQPGIFIHNQEWEYIFPIPYWDNKYLSKMDVPEKLRPIFRAAIKWGKNINRDKVESKKQIPHLHIWFPSA